MTDSFSEWYALKDGLVWHRKSPHYPVERGARKIPDRPSPDHKWSGSEWTKKDPPVISQDDLAFHYEQRRREAVDSVDAIHAILKGDKTECDRLCGQLDSLKERYESLSSSDSIPADYRDDKHWIEKRRQNDDH